MTGEASSDLTRVYVWQVPVRVTHWLIALSIIVLSVTGFYIGRPFLTVPGPAGRWFVMG
jgi:Ni/Fe-hydrogenase 1 B-type cytochrome subunit